jgi:NADH-quinone oxidoreductase subunit J
MTALAISLTPVSFVFGVLSLIAIVSALVVVLHRSPVVGAMGLVTNLLCIAGLYVLLNAHFFAALQVIVYAGAIVVLITFVIMLLNLQPEAKGGSGLLAAVFSAVLAGLLIVALGRASLGFDPAPEGADAPPLDAAFGSVQQVGDALFTGYFYPFLVISLALLAAMAGAVLLAKRNLED